MLAGFLLWTAAVRLVDVQSIGPQGSAVGFAALNRFIHCVTGVHMALYRLTDWLSILPLALAMGMALLGLVQWIRRRSLRRVDHSILVLGGFYLVVMAVYVFFEVFAVNYRPVLIDGALEASYPSSTTMLVMCVMPTARMQFHARIQNPALDRMVSAVISSYTVFMVLARLISGVHWFTDIIGGALLSIGLVQMYRGIVSLNGRAG